MKKVLVSFAVLLLLIGSVLLLQQPVLNACCASEYRRFEHPGQRYVVVVYRTPQLFALPGSAGDAPGFVRLLDQQGKILAEKNTEMVQQIEFIHWSKDRVDIKLFASWSLP